MTLQNPLTAIVVSLLLTYSSVVDCAPRNLVLSRKNSLFELLESKLSLLRQHNGYSINEIKVQTTEAGSEVDRFFRNKRIYLETSAFNYFVDNVDLPDLELTRAYQRKKGKIFVASPTLLWEIMLVSDRDHADKMLLAAQALFDPLLLGTPTELSARFLRQAYPNNVVNYDPFSRVEFSKLWRAMTDDFGRTFEYNLDDLKEKTRPFRLISTNLVSIIENVEHPNFLVDSVRGYVTTVSEVLVEMIDLGGLDKVTVKFVILYAYLFLLVDADLDSSEAKDLRRSLLGRDYNLADSPDASAVIGPFLEFPELFKVGPLLSMSMMAALQYKHSKTNRGCLHDGMHMVYAPYVDTILSNDTAFLSLANSSPYFRTRVSHISEIGFKRVKLQVAKFPNDRKLRDLDLID